MADASIPMNKNKLWEKRQPEARHPHDKNHRGYWARKTTGQKPRGEDPPRLSRRAHIACRVNRFLVPSPDLCSRTLMYRARRKNEKPPYTCALCAFARSCCGLGAERSRWTNSSELVCAASAPSAGGIVRGIITFQPIFNTLPCVVSDNLPDAISNLFL